MTHEEKLSPDEQCVETRLAAFQAAAPASVWTAQTLAKLEAAQVSARDASGSRARSSIRLRAGTARSMFGRPGVLISAAAAIAGVALILASSWVAAPHVAPVIRGGDGPGGNNEERQIPPAASGPRTPKDAARPGADRVFTASSVAEVEAFPADARKVTLCRHNDAMVAALARLERLETLKLLGSARYCSCAPSAGVTARGLEPLAKFGELKTLDLSGCEGLDDEWLGVVSGIPSLEKVVLYGGPRLSGMRDKAGGHSAAQSPRGASDKGVSALARLPHLRSLSLIKFYSNLTAESWRALAGVKTLRELRLDETWLEADAMAALAQARQIESLTLELTQLDDAGVTHLATMSALRELMMNPWKISDESVALLARLEALEKLEIDAIGFGDKGVAALAKLPHLRELGLPSCYGVSDAGIAAFVNHPRLRTISLAAHSAYSDDMEVSYTRITDESLKTFARMPALESVDLTNREQVTDVGLAALAQSKSIHTLILDQCSGVTEKSLMTLAGMKQLRELRLESCYGITDAVLEKLAVLPLLEKLDMGAYMSAKNIAQKANVTAAGLAHIARMPSIKSLRLFWRHDLGDAAMASLAASKTLEDLNISELPVTGKGLDELAKIRTLRKVDMREACPDGSVKSHELQALADALADCEVIGPTGKAYRARSQKPAPVPVYVPLRNYQDIADWASHLGLQAQGETNFEYFAFQALDLDDTNLGDIARNFGPFTHFDLRQCPKLTDAACTSLVSMKGLQYVDLSGQLGGLTDAGIDILAACPALQTLDLTGRTNISAAALARLQAQQPNLRIYPPDGSIQKNPLSIAIFNSLNRNDDEGILTQGELDSETMKLLDSDSTGTVWWSEWLRQVRVRLTGEASARDLWKLLDRDNDGVLVADEVHKDVIAYLDRNGDAKVERKEAPVIVAER